MRAILIAIPAAIGLMTAGAVAAPAQAGEWKINARLCPDLREDVRDRRVNNGRRDRAEDRRDSRVVNCPAQAFVWVGEKGRYRADLPRNTRVVVDRRGHYFIKVANRNVRIRTYG